MTTLMVPSWWCLSFMGFVPSSFISVSQPSMTAPSAS